jgi:hypothetical protein
VQYLQHHSQKQPMPWCPQEQDRLQPSVLIANHRRCLGNSKNVASSKLNLKNLIKDKSHNIEQLQQQLQQQFSLFSDL